jgi:carbamoyl-phosphate synthase small subunit
VKDIAKNRVVVTSQNHGYAVSEKGLSDLGLKVSHINVNDGTVEGIAHETLPLISVQFHPEASPGPMDSRYLFDEFLDMAAEWKTVNSGQ